MSIINNNHRIVENPYEKRRLMPVKEKGFDSLPWPSDQELCALLDQVAKDQTSGSPAQERGKVLGDAKVVSQEECVGKDRNNPPGGQRSGAVALEVTTDSDDGSEGVAPQTQTVPSLTQMIRADCAPTARPTPEQGRVIARMMEMRKSLEQFVRHECQRCNLNHSQKNLYAGLKSLRAAGADPRFIEAMHTLRKYGNVAAHNSQLDKLPTYDRCVDVVQTYLQLKQEHQRRSTLARFG